MTKNRNPQIAAYVIGPYTAPTTWQREQNIRAAQKTGRQLARSNILPLIPLAIYRNMYRSYEGACDSDSWYQATLELLKLCHAAVLADAQNWQSSKGSRREIKWCKANNLRVFFSPTDVLSWSRGIETIKYWGRENLPFPSDKELA